MGQVLLQLALVGEVAVQGVLVRRVAGRDILAERPVAYPGDLARQRVQRVERALHVLRARLGLESEANDVLDHRVLPSSIIARRARLIGLRLGDYRSGGLVKPESPDRVGARPP